jgi:DHA3 family macrolide efflux protein-like MFS transporter
MNWKLNTSLFLGGQALSLFGSMLVQYALFWHITLATQSGSMMTIYVLVALLPIFFLSPFGGVWADRYNRKRLIILSDGGIATVTLLIALSFLGGYRALWAVFLCAAVRAIGQGLQSPAVSAFLPQIVPQEHLARINGINTSIHSFISLASPIVSGALLTLAPLEYLLFIDILTAAIGIYILQYWVKVPPTTTPATSGQAATHYFHDLREGLRYIRHKKWIFQIILLATILFAALSPASFLTPLQVARKFGSEIWKLTAIEIAFSGGMILGGLLIVLRGGFRNPIHSMALACLLIGAGIIGLGLLHSFPLYLSAMFTVGLTVPFSNTPCMTLLQTKVAPEYMGRVFGVFSMTYSLTMPLAMLVFGPLADRVAIDLLLVISGIVVLLLSIPYLTSRALRDIGKPDTHPTAED